MDQVSQVREKIDIVSLVGEFLPLKKAGRNFKTNCPFHTEKTPSFIVSPERQIWHCFGCGKGGDVFTFLMEHENMEFIEALRTLAKRAGVTLSDKTFKSQYSEKEKIYNLNSLAQRFYNFLLTNHKIGKNALEYLLKNRNLNTGLINTFSLGYAPSDNSLSSYLIKKKGYKEKDLVDSGLAYIKAGKVFDFFKNRTIFPLTDHRGNVVGFSGRALSDSDMPKYINTKDTLVYHKGNLFFGLDRAKDEIKKTGSVILVEGEFDAISSFALGFKNVVAIKGTALTEYQTNLLARFAKKVTLCLDQDEAGYEATKRSLSNLEKNNLTTTVILLSSKDPDEAIRQNPSSFKKAVKNDVNVYDYLLLKVLSKYNKEDPSEKKRITEELLPFISEISNEVVKEHYIKKLAKEINASIESIQKELEKIKVEKIKDEILYPKTRKNRRELLEEYFLSLIIQNENPKDLLEKEEEFFQLYAFEIPAIKKLFSYLKDYLKHNQKLDIKRFSRLIPSELFKTFDTCYLYPLPKFINEEKFLKELEKVENDLKTLDIRQKIASLALKLHEVKNKKEQKGLQKEFSKLINLLPRA